ncbi:MAG: VWA domain-containing protein [Bryobacterales bacterium]|nr:VWA domain-containing protein [Bryobacterales bacterium]MBV9399910.1 VWA domain-containing protein [Bryobacterales bacterium]
MPRAFAARSDQQEEFTLRSETRLVLVDVSVQDGQRNYVTGLSKENFVLSEDGRPQTITIFDNEDLPVTVGILVDESRSMGPKRDDVLQAATELISESNPLDEVFVLNFNDIVTAGLPPDKLFSSDIMELQSALYRGFPQGRTALYDAVAAGLRQLKLGRQNRKTLVLISDGGDNASEHTRHDAVDLVENSFATIYTVGLYDADDPDSKPGILTHLAHISGGEAYFPENPPETIPICRRIAKEIRSRYTLGYRPEAGSGKERVRHLRIQVNAPGREHLRVRARESYRL